VAPGRPYDGEEDEATRVRGLREPIVRPGAENVKATVALPLGSRDALEMTMAEVCFTPVDP